MSTSYLLYRDVAPGADETATVTASGQYSASSIAQLPFGITSPRIATLEHNRWLLDGTFSFMPQSIAFWSTEISDDAGNFSNPPTITLSFPSQYTSVGFTLVFDTEAGEYCDSVTITWYQDGTQKATMDFQPDSTSYFCQNNVESFDKVIISLNKTVLPNRRARVSQIIIGVIRTFRMNELREVKIVNEMDLSSLSIPVSTMNWTLNSKEDVAFMFQLKQEVEAWNDNNLVGVYYIDSSSRQAQRLYQIECYDAMGVLDEVNFPGGVYSGKSAKALLREIVGSYFTLDMDSVTDTTLTGAIKACTCREAMQQVLFAWGVCVSTDGTNKIRVFQTSDTLTEIGKNRTFQGVSVDTSAIVTEVQVTSHVFAENTNGDIEINGTKYSDTTAVYSIQNPNVTANDKQKIITIENATLVSPSIAQAVAQRAYNYYLRRDTTQSKFVWRGEKLGDLVSQPTAWGDTMTGNLQKLTITLSNTVAADSETLRAVT